jgi:hypothetical protein
MKNSLFRKAYHFLSIFACSTAHIILQISPAESIWLTYLRQMQNRFAGELSLQQALRDISNLVPGSLHLNWRPQLLAGYQVREPGQIFRSCTTI